MAARKQVFHEIDNYCSLKIPSPQPMMVNKNMITKMIIIMEVVMRMTMIEMMIMAKTCPTQR